MKQPKKKINQSRKLALTGSARLRLLKKPSRNDGSLMKRRVRSLNVVVHRTGKAKQEKERKDSCSQMLQGAGLPAVVPHSKDLAVRPNTVHHPRPRPSQISLLPKIDVSTHSDSHPKPPHLSLNHTLPSLP